MMKKISFIRSSKKPSIKEPKENNEKTLTPIIKNTQIRTEVDNNATNRTQTD